MVTVIMPVMDPSRLCLGGEGGRARCARRVASAQGADLEGFGLGEQAGSSAVSLGMAFEEPVGAVVMASV
jgi:hypothetical protein